MKFEIKNRWSGALIFECDADSMKLAVELAVSQKVSLRAANLRAADLRAANLSDANLRAADLRAANLSDANLSDADLRAADLSAADLRAADLRAADLRAANLSDADLRAANLSDADLRAADLRAADLSAADLSDANLRDADLRAAKNLRLPTGETIEEYLRDVVPALLTSGGKTLESFRPHWDCHEWANCPMAHAFDVHSIGEIPALLRPRADQFVQLFDAGQIPVSVLGEPARTESAG